MRRIRILGFCVTALFVMAGLASVSASASTPTWYECAKASPSDSGNYANKTCSEASAPGKGGYELKEGLGKGKPFKAKSGKAILHVKTYLGDNTVECASSKETGNLALPNRETDVDVSYSKCYALHNKECASAGAKKGEIKIDGLKGELNYVSESPVEVGLKLESEANPGPDGELAKFSCGSPVDIEATVNGGVIGVLAKDVNAVSKEFEVIDLPSDYIGVHYYKGDEYTPIVNIPAWSFEQEALAAEIKEDEEGKIAKIERPIIKALICGEYIEELLHEKCTPEAYSGLESTTAIKGEALEIKA